MAAFMQAILGWWLVVTLALITVVDFVAIAAGRPEATVSRWVYELGNRHPLLYLVLGLTIGHLIVPLVLNARNTNP